MNSHWAPTVWAHMPTLATTTPSHSHANARCRNGASAEVAPGTGAVAVLTTVPGLHRLRQAGE